MCDLYFLTARSPKATDCVGTLARAKVTWLVVHMARHFHGAFFAQVIGFEAMHAFFLSHLPLLYQEGFWRRPSRRQLTTLGGSNSGFVSLQTGEQTQTFPSRRRA